MYIDTLYVICTYKSYSISKKKLQNTFKQLHGLTTISGIGMFLKTNPRQQQYTLYTGSVYMEVILSSQH